jgi:hypothetical protein
MLGWLWKKGKSRLKTHYELPQDPLYIPQLDGTRVRIRLKAISDPEKKLGVYTCLTGNFSHHVAHILTMGSEYAERLGSQRLLARDAWMGTCYQLFPKLIYGAAAFTHSPQKLEDVFESNWYKLLPSLRVKRNITKEYRKLLLWFQGLALPNLNIDALSKKFHLLQLHWDTGSTLGRMLHQAYQVFQVEVGLGKNILSRSFISFGRLATHGFFRNLWELLHRYGVVFCLHPDFDIPLLWEQDRTLMDAVHNMRIFNRREQETLNQYRHCKRVNSIGDMACSDGQTIDPTMLTQEAGQSSRDFPLQVRTEPDHKLWLKMIHSLTQADHRLLHPLGRYIGAPHRPDEWFLCETLGSLFLKVDSGSHDVYTLNQTPHSSRYGTTYTYSHHDTGPCLES